MDSANSREDPTIKSRSKGRWSWLVLVAASVCLLAIPFVAFLVLPKLSRGLERKILTLWPFIVAVVVMLVVMLWRRWFGLNLHHVWLKHSVFAGFVFGACFGNLAFPILGMIMGMAVGPIVGLVGGTIVSCIAQVLQRGMGWRENHRQYQALSVLLVLLGAIGLLLWFAPHFDDLPSKYISKGEYLRRYLSLVGWPVLLLLTYVGIAAEPSSRHPILGDGSRARRTALYALIGIAFFSSLYIGGYWLSDSFPHPD